VMTAFRILLPMTPLALLATEYHPVAASPIGNGKHGKRFETA